VNDGIYRYGLVDAGDGHGKIFAYEVFFDTPILASVSALRGAYPPLAPPCWCSQVDGFGNATLMDDANVPSLLALASGVSNRDVGVKFEMLFVNGPIL
jgi:meiotically up-regulated gene 157 (Mug157) protein